MLEVEPVVDTIESASKTTVWGSIDNLRRRSDSGAVSLIREVIKKNDAEIKFLASIGLEKMEENFQKQIIETGRNWEENHTLESAARYLRASIAYLKSGLSSIELNKSMIQKLFNCCDDVLHEDNENAEIRFFKAQLLFLDGQKDACLSLLEDIISKNDFKSEMLLEMAKIAFACGDLEKTLFLLEKISKSDQPGLDLESDGFDIEREELIEFWFPEEVNNA
jgi:tetratricopeptide (TPR) repeat protein